MVLDKEQSVSAARSLKDEFLELLKVVLDVVSTADVDLFKLCVNWFFNSERQTTPLIEQQLKELDAIPTSPGVLNCLVRKNFIGYLNYKLLKVFQKMVDSEELKKRIELYEIKHDEFIHSVSFNTIIEVFKQHLALAPASHIGLPEFEIYLETPWNGKLVYEWTEFFEMRLSWPRDLFVIEVSRMCIVFTYAVLPIFISSVVRDRTDPEVLRELEKAGVKVQLSKELVEMNDRISETVTNKVGISTVVAKSANFSDQLSSSKDRLT